MEIIIYLLIIFFVLLEGFFAGIETAYISVNNLKMKSLMHNKHGKKIKKLLKLLKNSNKTLSALLAGTNISVVGATSFASLLLIRKYGDVGELYATLIMSFIILLFGEILPKSIYRKTANIILLKTANILYFFIILFTPIINFILFLIKHTPVLSKYTLTQRNSDFSREDLKTLFKVSARQGVIKEADKELFNSLFEFSETYVREIMVPLIDIILIESSKKVIDVIKLNKKTGHSRIPVYENYVYNIIGYVYVLDLLKAKPNEDINKYIRPPYYVPETKKIDDLFVEINEQRLPMVFVVDEYGGVSGMVTLEDVVEEIVGEINENPKEIEEDKIKVLKNNIWMVEGDIDIDDLNDEIGSNIDKNGFETLAGFMEYVMGKIPEKNESIRYRNFKFVVYEATIRKIVKVKIEKIVRAKKK